MKKKSVCTVLIFGMASRMELTSLRHLILSSFRRYVALKSSLMLAQPQAVWSFMLRH